MLKQDYKPQSEFVSKSNLSSVHFNFRDSLFVTGGSLVQVWSASRSHPVSTFDWGLDSVIKVRFNPSEVRPCSQG